MTVPTNNEGPAKEANSSNKDDASHVSDLSQDDPSTGGTTEPDNIVVDSNDENGVEPPDQPLPAPHTSSRSTSRSERTRINFLQDDKSEMTYARRMAVSLMAKTWYNPHAAKDKDGDGIPDDEAESVGASMVLPDNVQAAESYPFSHSRRETPSLAKAWAYFEHVALPRHLLRAKPNGDRANNCCQRVIHRYQKGNQTLDRAEQGERHLPSKLYNPIFTPHKQLGDWGLGIGLYFSTLRAICVLTLLAGVLNTSNFMYFSSADYDVHQQQNVSRGVLKGSAICTDVTWVACSDCTADHFADSRIANATVTGVGNITFALRNNCEGAVRNTAYVNYATLFFIMLGVLALNVYMKRMEVAFDEDEQTAQDYSIVIDNPPPDATDPNEWKQFFYDHFEQAHVTACTIAVDNDLLVNSLVERREKLRQVEMMVEPGTSLDQLTLAGIAANIERERKFMGQLLANVIAGIPELFARIVVLTAKVQGLAQQDYPASNVFITFETEAMQRRVLSALSVGTFAAMRQNKSAVANTQYLFRGERVLSVLEPDEPNTIRWQDLNEKFKERVKQQVLTTFCTCVAIVLIAFIVRVLRTNASNAASAYAIAIFNSIFPMFGKFLTGMEAHSSEGGKQRSLYFKIALFRWVNTAVVITLITPFTLTLQTTGLIPQIYALFFAEIVTTNAIQLADPMGHINRHYLAPRAKTQDAMNLKMQGQPFELAERYTNMTKILFLALWYCAIYPGAFFMCSFALLINYFTDRFSLMRTWKRAPQLGEKISEFSRNYFFSLAIMAMALLSSYYWAGFPFDNLCDTQVAVDPAYVGTHTIQPFDGSAPQRITVTATQDAYEFCRQDFFRYDANETSFPFIARSQRDGAEWMTDEQEEISNVFGWTSVGVMGLVVLSFLYVWYHCIGTFFRGEYKVRGKDQNIHFSDVPSISAYVPQIESTVFSYPLLACNVDNIDKELLDWTDPDRPYVFYDLTKDAEVLLRGTDVSSKVVFSQIHHYPPEDGSKNNDKEDTNKKID